MTRYANPVSRNARPRAIRGVTKKGRDGRPKVARDRIAHIQIERIRAQVPKPCRYHACPNRSMRDQFGEQGYIAPGTEFARLISGDLKGTWRRGNRMIPDYRDYHFECVPPEARPLVRFFQPIL